MKTLILDCDGVLYPEYLQPISMLVSAMKKQALSNKITIEQYNKISAETIKRGEDGMFNFILNLVGKNMNLFDKFCKNMIDSIDYNNIKRDDELYKLLLKVGKNYEICIFTNNHIYHLDKIYRVLFGKKLEEFPFKSYDITSTFKDGIFHPKQRVYGYPNFLKKIKKKNTECIVYDDSRRNIKRCIENKIPYEYITDSYTLKIALNKLLNQ